MRLIWMLWAMLALGFTGPGWAFDHDYRAYGQLLERHVRLQQGGSASAVDYAALLKNRAALEAVLADWSAVTPETFEGWTHDQQKAFLINAYNGFTLELILTRYPDLNSIRDLGSLFRSAWKNEFFTLLGAPRHLDWVEHETLRPGYPDARIHFAVNCASVGCPALQPEPFRAASLDAQMEEATQRFLMDRSRNRFDAARGVLHVTPLLRWYREDFTVDGRADAAAWLAQYAAVLANTDADRARIAAQDFRIRYTEYDWSLNDLR